MKDSNFKMRIAQLAPLSESIPPACYGGTERVVSWLVEELVRRGHAVTLFASRCSTTRAKLVSAVDRALRPSNRALMDPLAFHIRSLGLLQDRINEFDIVHSHLDYLAFPAFCGASKPLLTTLHGRLDLEGLPEVYRQFADMPLVSISRAQRAPIPDARWIANIYHGLPLNDYRPGPGAGDYFVFLGRIAPEKRPHVAIEIARRAGVRLVIAAKIDRVDRRYYEKTVAPLLSDPRIEFVGEVDERGKAELLRNARALLFPVLWPEPFGLAMIEAMAYGTPVIARRCGSTPEVVAHGKTGYLCEDDDALLDAVKRVDHIDRAACRRWVEERFSVGRMADEYETVYRALLEARPGVVRPRGRVAASLDDHDFGGTVPAPDLDADVSGVTPQLEIDQRVSDPEIADLHVLEEGGEERILEENPILAARDAQSKTRLEYKE